MNSKGCASFECGMVAWLGCEYHLSFSFEMFEDCFVECMNFRFRNLSSVRTCSSWIHTPRCEALVTCVAPRSICDIAQVKPCDLQYTLVFLVINLKTWMAVH